jgi:hypothetical protein
LTAIGDTAHHQLVRPYAVGLDVLLLCSWAATFAALGARRRLDLSIAPVTRVATRFRAWLRST